MRSRTALLVGLGGGTPIAVALVVGAVLLSHRSTSMKRAANAADYRGIGHARFAHPSGLANGPARRDNGSADADPHTAGNLGDHELSDVASDNKCADVRVWYDNRSDTAIDVVTQSFQTSYTPTHRDGTYPNERNGPTKTLSEQLGIPAFSQKVVDWNVCAPELVPLQNSPPPDGTDSFQEEIGAEPTHFTWTWFHQ